MKKTIIILFLFVSYAIQTKADKIHGILKTLDNTEMEVEFDIPMKNGVINLEKFQKRVKYINDKGKKESIALSELDEINFELKGKNYRFIALETKLGGIITAKRTRLLQLLIDGDVRLLSIHHIDHVKLNSTLYISEKDSYVINIEGRSAEMLTLFNHKKITSRLSKRCKVFKEEMANNKFGINETVGMINFYNRNCSK